MNLYELHSNPTALIKADKIPAKLLMTEVFPARTKLMHETGEIDNNDTKEMMGMMTRNKDVENYLLNDAEHVEDLLLFYARNVIGGRWKEAEKHGLHFTYAGDIYDYAKQVIKGRWPEKEDIISKNWEYAYYYATNIIRDRWDGKYAKQAEDAISKDTRSAVAYAIYIDERWDEETETNILNAWGNDKAEYITHFDIKFEDANKF